MIDKSAHRRVTIALAICLFLLVSGTVGYMVLEDYALIEGLYMTVITLTTVGFREVKPLSQAGQVFTIVFLIVGFVSLAFVAHAVVESLLEDVWSSGSMAKKMKKQISHLKSHFIICGYGRAGAAAAEHFREAGSEFVIIETDPKHCHEIQEKDFRYIEGDATNESVLLDAGIKSASGLLALLNSDPGNLFIVLTARELNPMLHIIARAEDHSSEKKTYQAGADSVISPFATAGKQIAVDMLMASGKTQLQGRDALAAQTKVQWLPVENGSGWLGDTIHEVARQTEQEIIGLRRGGKDSIFPDPATRIEPDDKLLVAVNNERDKTQSSSPKPRRNRKLVIVDDSQAILRLYTRLFRKSGFRPQTTTNGKEGLDLILREKPEAAVIDHWLPELSGIEICRRVRATDSCRDIKLILFTTEEEREIQEEAFHAGVDAVVVKSSETSEVIDTVMRVLEKERTGDLVSTA